MSRGRIVRRGLGALAALGILAFVVANATYYYLFPGYCKRLASRAQDPDVQRALESWVAVNWSGERVPLENVLDYDGIVPGVRWLSVSFDGSLLGMGSEAHVRLLGVEAGDLLADAVAPNVKAIYFTERSRFGVVVQLPNREVLIPTWASLTPVSGTTSVLCMQ
jgi:hypothetical protein